MLYLWHINAQVLQVRSEDDGAEVVAPDLDGAVAGLVAVPATRACHLVAVEAKHAPFSPSHTFVRLARLPELRTHEHVYPCWLPPSSDAPAAASAGTSPSSAGIFLPLRHAPFFPLIELKDDEEEKDLELESLLRVRRQELTGMISLEAVYTAASQCVIIGTPSIPTVDCFDFSRLSRCIEKIKRYII